MKRKIAGSLLALLICLGSATADEGIDKLCRELLNSLAADDPVAYAQCYTTYRQTEQRWSKVEPPLPEHEMKRLLGKLRERNTTIRHSFRIMREQIADPKAKIEFVSAEAEVNTKTFMGVVITGTTDLVCRFRVNDEEWILDLDDAILLDGHWFITDDPASLETPANKINFRPSGKDKYGRIIYGRVTEKN